jgi:hypothetical protein
MARFFVNVDETLGLTPKVDKSVWYSYAGSDVTLRVVEHNSCSHRAENYAAIAPLAAISSGIGFEHSEWSVIIAAKL